MEINKTNQIPTVYYAESDPPDFINKIAISPAIGKRVISWTDTVRIRKFILSSINVFPSDALKKGIAPETISIITANGIKLNLRLMTLSLYNENVKNDVAGKIDFDSIEALIDYYLNADFSSY